MAKHNVLGQLGEQFAIQYLQRKGYTIIEVDWRFEHKDIDIVAFDNDDNVLVFVEVKTRTSDAFGEPHEAVSRAKMQNLIRCANIFIRQKHYNGNARFDVISLVGHSMPFRLTHIKDAFNSATVYS
ncbi:MAG: YraN family protein [Bacteroidia bacterium]|nr:YraN family protein [Bacteroidia bacterium]